MSETLLIILGFIVVSYLVGIWVGTKIKSPKIIVREAKGGTQQKNLKNKMGLPPRRR